MEWDKDSTIEFIDIYKKFLVLWDPKHPDYYNKIRKQDAWKEVAKQSQRSVDECKKKMETLLAAMRREKMKKKSRSSCIGSGADEVYKSSWFAFESLQFLWDKNKPKQTPNTLPRFTNNQEDSSAHDTEDESQSNPPTVSLNETSQTYQNKSAPAKRPLATIPTTSTQKIARTNEGERSGSAFEILQYPSAATPADDSYYFGNFVATRLREYDSKTRFSIQSDIMALLARANDGYYTRGPCFPRYETMPSHSYVLSPNYSDSSNSQLPRHKNQSTTDTQHSNNSLYQHATRNAVEHETILPLTDMPPYFTDDCNSRDHILEELLPCAEE